MPGTSESARPRHRMEETGWTNGNAFSAPLPGSRWTARQWPSGATGPWTTRRRRDWQRPPSTSGGFQREWDWDFVKVTPSSSFCLRDWGVRDEWRGNPEGTRDSVFRPVQSPDDWARLTVLDPRQGSLGAQLTALGRIRAALGDEVPVIQTVFSPLAQAKNLAGEDRLILHLRRYPDALHRGLETITETTVRFVEAVREWGAEGIFYAVQHARYGYMSKAEYRLFGHPYDLRILEAAQGMGFNILHLHGEAVIQPCRTGV